LKQKTKITLTIITDEGELNYISRTKVSLLELKFPKGIRICQNYCLQKDLFNFLFDVLGY